MRPRPPRPTRTDPLFPYTTLCLSQQAGEPQPGAACRSRRARRVATIHAIGQILLGRLQPHDCLACPVKSLSMPPPRPNLQVSVFSRSEEHTSELQSLMRISYAVFCLKKKNNYSLTTTLTNHQLILSYNC